MNENDDDSLIEQYRSGNAAAFDLLYDRYRLPVFNYIVRHVHSRNIAEDIFQDVWFKVIKTISQYRHQGRFLAWLFTIARNRLTDYWRSNSSSLSEEITEDLHSQNPLQEHLQFIRDCVEKLKQLIGLLKPEQRDAFVLQQESGLSIEQIAEVSSCGRETIKSRLRYAMNKLREGLEDCDDY